MNKSNRAVVLVSFLLVAAILAIGALLFKPKILDGASKRASSSVETTKKLEDVNNSRGATVSASLVKIGEVAASEPKSPGTAFIGKEVELDLTYLPPPDPMALIEAERRKNAFLEGKLDEVNKLYGAATSNSKKLQKDFDLATAAKVRSDNELVTAAAVSLAMEKQRNQAIVAFIVAVLFYLYVKFTHLSPGAMAEAISDIRSGTPAVQALDGVSSRAQQRLINLISRLRG